MCLGDTSAGKTPLEATSGVSGDLVTKETLAKAAVLEPQPSQDRSSPPRTTPVLRAKPNSGICISEKILRTHDPTRKQIRFDSLENMEFAQLRLRREAEASHYAQDK